MNSITTVIIQMVSNIPIDILSLYCWEQCLDNKNISKLKIFLIAFIMTIITAVLNYNVAKDIRMFIIITLLITINYFCFSKKLNKAILSVLILEAFLWIAEFTFVIGVSIINKDNIYNFLGSISGFIIINAYITIILFLSYKNKVFKKIYSKLRGILKAITINETALYLIMIMLVIITSTIESYMNLPVQIVLTTNTIMALVFIIIIIKFTSFKSRFNKINGKYQTSISSLREYESMIDKFRVNNHENKNELMTIRNMIKAKDKNTTEYIDKLVDNKIKDNEKILYKTAKIPEGGLRATIYSKLCVMDELKIKYILDIANDVRAADLINLNDETVLSICKILGVFLDNAIDAVKDLKKRNIDIEIYVMDERLCIDITNKIKGDLDLNKLGNKKYTTKGEGHGYGLSLVNQIIRENSEILENEKSINGDNFTQTLKIKM